MLKGCVLCCAPYTLICGILLLCLHFMVRHHNWTFNVIIAKEDWNRKEKAACCLNAGIFYIVVSLVLWLGVLFQTLLVDIGDLGNWRRYYQGSILKTMVYLYRRRQSHRKRTRQFFRQKRKEKNSLHAEMKELEHRQLLGDGFYPLSTTTSSPIGGGGMGEVGPSLYFREAYRYTKDLSAASAGVPSAVPSPVAPAGFAPGFDGFLQEETGIDTQTRNRDD